MGQLEKYGLYVLCLVIFCILGVTIWGDPKSSTAAERTPSTAIRASGDRPSGERSSGDVVGQRPEQGAAQVAAPRPGDDGLARELQSLIGPVARSGDERRTQDPVRGEAGKPATEPAVKGLADQQAGNIGGAKPESVGAGDQKRGSYVVQTGDSFDSIARSKLGNAALREELQRLNPKVVPSKMKVGQELVLPSPADIARLTAPAATTKTVVAKEAAIKVASEPKATTDAATERSYMVGKGDTFERIARAELGSSKRVEELRELNPSVDPTRLRIGQRIKLPKK